MKRIKIGSLSIGIGLVLFGALWLLDALGIIKMDVLSICLPVLVIIVGIILIGRAFQKEGWLDWI
jgi:uncharacterized membrane protein YidH (DUF202 family)